VGRWEERYREGETRLPEDRDERQRQLTRLGNVAWGAGLAALLEGRCDAAVEWLLQQSGDDPNMGARPLRRAIQKHVEDPVSEILIASRDEKPEAIEVRVGPEGLTVIAREPEPIVQGT